MRVFTVLIHWIVIYAVNSAIHLLNKRDQVTEVFKGLCHVTSVVSVCFSHRVNDKF